MIRSACLLPVLIFYSFAAFAQSIDGTEKTYPATIKVSGFAVDSLSDQPLEYSPVRILRQGASQDAFQGKTVNADSSGYFEFREMPPGNYELQIFYVGYSNLLRSLEIPEDTGDRDLGRLQLTPLKTNLKEVEVVGQKQLIEQRPEGLVYNAEKDGSNIGSTAEELLKKVPMVTVDLDGNLKLRGSSNIRVLIDGKPSTMIAASVKDAIRQLPADNIKSVEVLTTPGAKYDAEGTAGVINIITKKNFVKGISGNTYSSLTYRPEQDRFSTNLGGNINYRKGKFGLGTYLGGGHWESKSANLTKRTDAPGTTEENQLLQSGESRNNGNYYYGGISADYQLDSLQSLQAGINLNTGNSNSRNSLDSRMSRPSSRNIRHIESGPNVYNSLSGNLAYTKKFRDDKGPELSLLSQYSHAPGENGYALHQYGNTDDQEEYREENENKSQNDEFTVQADYAHPFAKHNRKLETGAKYIRRTVASDYRLMYGIPLANDNMTEDPLRTNKLNYSQEVASFYGQYTSQLAKNLSGMLGIRYEHTGINGRLRDKGGSFTSQFDNLLPNAVLIYSLKNYSNLKLSYNQRIERPSINYINPFISYSDPYNLSYGNPALEPERAHNIELGYSGFIAQALSVSLTGFYRFTGNGMESVSDIMPDGVRHTTYRNIAKNNTVGFNMYTGGTLAKKLTFNLSANLYYKQIVSTGLSVSNSGWQFDGNAYVNYKLKRGFSLEGSGYYGGRQIALQGVSTGWYSYSLGVKKEVLKGKGNLVLRGENLFTPKVIMSSDNVFGTSRYHNEYIYFGRGVTVAFNYSFGKMKYFKSKTIVNDDLKGGGGQQGMGGK